MRGQGTDAQDFCLFHLSHQTYRISVNDSSENLILGSLMTQNEGTVEGVVHIMENILNVHN